MRRILIYAAIYGGLGVTVGVLMALYTKDAEEAQAQRTIALNGTGKPRAVPTPSPTPAPPVQTVTSDEPLPMDVGSAENKDGE